MVIVFIVILVRVGACGGALPASNLSPAALRLQADGSSSPLHLAPGSAKLAICVQVGLPSVHVTRLHSHDSPRHTTDRYHKALSHSVCRPIRFLLGGNEAAGVHERSLSRDKPPPRPRHRPDVSGVPARSVCQGQLLPSVARHTGCSWIRGSRAAGVGQRRADNHMHDARTVARRAYRGTGNHQR